MICNATYEHATHSVDAHRLKRRLRTMFGATHSGQSVTNQVQNGFNT